MLFVLGFACVGFVRGFVRTGGFVGKFSIYCRTKVLTQPTARMVIVKILFVCRWLGDSFISVSEIFLGYFPKRYLHISPPIIIFNN